MASVNHKSHSRRRSASDPFTDQAAPRRTAPTPPPKSSHKSPKMPTQAAVKSAPANRETHREVSERDAVVKVDGSSGRNRMGRSHTALFVIFTDLSLLKSNMTSQNTNTRLPPSSNSEYSPFSIAGLRASTCQCRGEGQDKRKTLQQEERLSARRCYR